MTSDLLEGSTTNRRTNRTGASLPVLPDLKDYQNDLLYTSNTEVLGQKQLLLLVNFLEKHLSKQSIGACVELCREVGVSFEAVPTLALVAGGNPRQENGAESMVNTLFVLVVRQQSHDCQIPRFRSF